MEPITKAVETSTLTEEYLPLLETAETLPLLISGGSMAPFLVHGRDTVFLARVSRPLKRGDIVLYRRKNGACILHRICTLEGDTFSLVGDAQTGIERGIEQDQILAVAVRALRKGKAQAPGRFWWDFFAKVWIRVIPARPALLRLYSFLTKAFRRTK